MLLKLRQFVNDLNKPKNYLLIANVLLVFFLILLSNLKIIPLATGDLIFFSLLFLAFSLYRPGWAFLLFIGSIALENISLTQESLGVNVRPYQFIGALVVFSVAVRFFSKKLSFDLARFKPADYLLLGFLLMSILSSLASAEKLASLRLSLILGTFFILYLLVKNYVRDGADAKRILPFFLGSSVLIAAYGIWQNARYLSRLKSFEVMFGRPNATFTEPDWLGMFLVISIAVILSLIYYFWNKPSEEGIGKSISVGLLLSHLALIIFYIALILTVARSSWLGGFCVTFLFLFITLTDLRFKNWQWNNFFKATGGIIVSGLLSIAAVYVFHLTNFQLFNRATSTQTGLQKITVSCKTEVDLPEKIGSLDELGKYGCRHIDLEEIGSEKEAGNMIGEIERNDPNVDIRGAIYEKSWQAIKNNPILGIGLGAIGDMLGKDPRGITLNSSNIFLEALLGSGVIGFICFLLFLIFVFVDGVKGFFFAKDISGKTIGIFIIISWFAILTPNMFNTGMFLGFLWVWMAIAQIKNS